MAFSKLRSLSVIPDIGTEQENFIGNALPTLGEVMSVFFYEIRGCHDKRHAARNTVKKVRALWDCTVIPRMQDIKAIMKIEKTHKEWRGLQRHKKDRGQTDDSEERAENFKKQIGQLFDFSVQGAEEIMGQHLKSIKIEAEKEAWEEDLRFLQDQKGPRLMSIGDADKKLRREVINIKAAEQRREEKEEKRIGKLLGLDARKRKDEEKRRKSGKFFFITIPPPPPLPVTVLLTYLLVYQTNR